jgi:hypothetical protein
VYVVGGEDGAVHGVMQSGGKGSLRCEYQPFMKTQNGLDRTQIGVFFRRQQLYVAA